MSWQQLIKPDVAINEKAGMCLSYARKAFGRPAVEPTAWDGWNKAQYKHADRDFPSGVAHPVWFDWWGDIGNGRHQYGHVAVRDVDGTIWSSPLAGTGRAWFATVDDLVRAFGNGMKYVGWSEDISGARVIKEGGKTMDAAALAALYQLGAIKQIHGDDKFVKDNLGKDPAKVITDLLNSAAHKEVISRYYAKGSASKPSVTQLKPGLYEVK